MFFLNCASFLYAIEFIINGLTCCPVRWFEGSIWTECSRAFSGFDKSFQHRTRQKKNISKCQQNYTIYGDEFRFGERSFSVRFTRLEKIFSNFLRTFRIDLLVAVCTHLSPNPLRQFHRWSITKSAHKFSCCEVENLFTQHFRESWKARMISTNSCDAKKSSLSKTSH